MIETGLASAILAAAVGSSLIAGVFFAFSSFVMAGLRNVPVAQGVAAMQAINVTVLRSTFLAVFMATAVLSALLIVVAVLRWGRPGCMYIVVGGLCYVIGSFLVTAVFNVPLNDKLALVGGDALEMAEVWGVYLRDWMLWNHVRTVFSLLAALFFILAHAT
ncbi:anthrone oxygenase family protein [Aestuariispira ectoiniformans]|uniref:anthrone oxygenase family protein n=1 Tax=Aestuariispira ectoiniformans TaxID=2775080 RepID=UPI00223B519B|nr:anthrone oxygenase family protein [Aestuariispira ectoiniformans]